MPRGSRSLVLFDIDGTLVDVRGAGRRAFAAGIEEAWGIADDLFDVNFAGATDLLVLQQLRRRLVLPQEGETRFFRAMERALSAALLAEPPRVFSGVKETLSALAVSSDVVLGLVTGNSARCATVKIEAGGIPRTWFSVGAFGDEHADRNELARRAREAATRGHGAFTTLVLVGDTPADIVAAHMIGAHAVAVTTGHYDRAQLLAAGAHFVVDDLRDWTNDALPPSESR